MWKSPMNVVDQEPNPNLHLPAKHNDIRIALYSKVNLSAAFTVMNQE